jgi:hypothetical protein
MDNIKKDSKKVNPKKNQIKYKQHKTAENEQLRKFLTYYANMSKQKRVIIYFMKRVPASDSSNRESLIPVQVSLGSKRTLGLDESYSNINYNKGFVLYAPKITNNICENIIQESSDSNRKIEVFFSVQELKKNVRKEDEILNITTFPYFDDIPSANINQELITQNFTLTDFPFPIQYATETSPGNFQLFWSLKYPQPVKNVNYWKQVLAVMKIVGNNIIGHVDTGGSNINQIYRLPNTYNYKQKYNQPPKTKLIHFDKSNALEFKEVWTWILNKYIKLKYKSFTKKYNKILKIITKQNDYTLLENITGDFEHHKTDKMTPSERSMSLIKRLFDNYKLPKNDIYNFWKETPNEEKSKGHLTKNQKQYFNRIWEKITPKTSNNLKVKPQRKITISDRALTIKTFFEVPALLFSRKKDIKVKVDKDRSIGRHSRKGLSTKTGTILLWLISQAVKNNYEFKMPTKEFFKKWNLSDKKFSRFQEQLEFFLFTDSHYKSIREFKNSTLNIIGGLERSGGYVKFALAEDFRKVLKRENKIKKVFDNKFFDALEYTNERYTLHLLFILNFYLYDKIHYATISLKEFSKRLGFSIKSKSSRKKAAQRLRDSLDELTKLKMINFSYKYNSKKEEFSFQKHKSLVE